MLSPTKPRPIYLDHHATTPVDPRVAAAVADAMQVHFGNSNSREHVFGLAAAAAEDDARISVAELIGAEPDDVHYTASATEGIRLALAIAAGTCGSRPLRVALPATEHAAVIEAVTRLERAGRADVSWIDVDNAGRVDIEELEVATAGADLLCLMAANNEVETIHPIERAAEVAHRNGAAILVDATQAAGKIVLKAHEWAVDYMTMSSHVFRLAKLTPYRGDRRPKLALTHF